MTPICRALGLEEDKITWYSNRRTTRLQHFEGLEEGKITWYSNQHSQQLVNRVGLSEDKITWYSNQVSCLSLSLLGLEEDKITWYSNSCCYRSTRFGEEKATWYSNPVWQTIVMVCKKVKLHGSQTMYNIAPKSPPWVGRK